MSATVSKSDDFPDRISPMLVKELRQGMRAKTFIGIFLALQGFLALMILTAGAGSASDNVGEAISLIIFLTFSLAVLAIQPMRGLTAVSSEVVGNTIDMMVLTRLSAWRIVFGKWVAIVSQSALLLCTIIPYLILRYFFGGMNLLGELVALAMIFIGSMVLTAITVGISGSPSKILRGLILMAWFGALLSTLWGMAMAALMGGTGLNGMLFPNLDRNVLIGLGVFVAFSLYWGWSALSLGASMIAPAAENQSTLRRLIALVCVGLLCLLALIEEIHPEAMLMLVGMVSGPAAIIALSESSQMVPSVWVPFYKRGVLGKGAGIIFAPGWASGVIFTLLLIGVSVLPVVIAASQHSYGWDKDLLFVCLVTAAGLMVPGLLVSFGWHSVGERVANFVLISIGLGILALCLGGISEYADSPGYLWAFAWNPIFLLIMHESHEFSESAVLVAAVILNLLLITLLLVRAGAILLHHRSVMEDAKRLASDEPLDDVETVGIAP